MAATLDGPQLPNVDVDAVGVVDVVDTVVEAGDAGPMGGYNNGRRRPLVLPSFPFDNGGNAHDTFFVSRRT